MKDLPLAPPQTALRPPETVMRLSRLGASFPTRLSFLRVLTRTLSREGARLTRPVWDIDSEGYGRAVYTLPLGGHRYSLVAISSPLPDEMRTDRVIATAWDTAYVLYDGVPSTSELERIAENAPRQEAGRFTERDLVLSRANKSVRLFNTVVGCLRAGQQPDPRQIAEIGYLMRTTAVYGNGKFGIADRGVIEDRPGLSGAFAAEMLTVWLIRSFTHDLVEHLGGAPLAPGLKRNLGIGNSTGLGMAPFLVSHPVLLHNWIVARETALARVRAVSGLNDETRHLLQDLAARASRHLDAWKVPDPTHQSRIDSLRQAWPKIMDAVPGIESTEALYRLSEPLSDDVQELTVALLIEAFPELVDGLSDCMTDPLGLRALPFTGTAELRDTIDACWDWALAIPFDCPTQTHQFWYVSEEKLEPRLGNRHEEQGAERESPLDIARRVQALRRDLETAPDDLRAFRAAHPEHELALRRVLTQRLHPYAEIRDNLIAQTCLPIDMLRCKLAFFGAARFDPKSDRWTRVTLAQGAPLPEDLGTARADDWWLPTGFE